MLCRPPDPPYWFPWDRPCTPDPSPIRTSSSSWPTADIPCTRRACGDRWRGCRVFRPPPRPEVPPPPPRRARCSERGAVPPPTRDCSRLSFRSHSPPLLPSPRKNPKRRRCRSVGEPQVQSFRRTRRSTVPRPTPQTVTKSKTHFYFRGGLKSNETGCFLLSSLRLSLSRMSASRRNCISFLGAPLSIPYPAPAGPVDDPDPRPRCPISLP
mmetsp:Transcript_4502/g.8765  ORF Transcript_4502/g.8765 Transcript_4502/m.8765 type:complete len:211 (-) Transcript_4502:377-1009(-)